MQKIVPCIWFNNNAQEAVRFYTTLFKKSKIGSIIYYDEYSAKPSGMPVGAVLTIDFQLQGQRFTALNGGPLFKPTPSLSFFVYGTSKEIDTYYQKLSEGGKIMMALDAYPFSKKYAFIEDKFGVSWQLMLSQEKRPITPCLLFVGKNMGNAQAAVKLYTKLFKHAKIQVMETYGSKDVSPKGTVKFCSFTLEGQEFIAMDGAGPHTFGFTEGISLMINCDTQKDIDYFWNKLTANGGEESYCGWLKDKFGVSWQVTPSVWSKLITGPHSKKYMQAMMTMKKLDIATLKKAAK